MVGAGPRRASWSKVGGAGGRGGGGWGLNVQQYYQVGRSRYLLVLVIMAAAVMKYQVLISPSWHTGSELLFSHDSLSCRVEKANN